MLEAKGVLHKNKTAAGLTCSNDTVEDWLEMAKVILHKWMIKVILQHAR